MKKQKRSTKKPAACRSAPPACSAPVGWICPKCGKGLAPWVRECDCVSISITLPTPPAIWREPTTGDPLPPVPAYVTVCGPYVGRIFDAPKETP